MQDVDADDASCRWTSPFLCLLSPAELQQIWSGSAVTKEHIRELQRVAKVHPEVKQQAGWLWDIFFSFDDEKRRTLYKFVTGSSRRPAAGFTDFKIGPKAGGDG